MSNFGTNTQDVTSKLNNCMAFVEGNNIIGVRLSDDIAMQIGALINQAISEGKGIKVNVQSQTGSDHTVKTMKFASCLTVTSRKELLNIGELVEEHKRGDDCVVRIYKFTDGNYYMRAEGKEIRTKGYLVYGDKFNKAVKDAGCTLLSTKQNNDEFIYTGTLKQLRDGIKADLKEYEANKKTTTKKSGCIFK